MSLKLGNVANALNINSDGWHSAKFDTEALIEVTDKMIKLFTYVSGRDLHPEKHFL